MQSTIMFVYSVLIRASLFMRRVKHGGFRFFALAVALAICLALASSATNPVMPTYAQGPELEVTSTIPIPAEILASVVETLRSRPANILPGSKLIITSLDQSSGWALMTVAVQPSDPDEDILANSTLVIARSVPGGWSNAIWGTDAYEALLTEAPSSLVPAESKPLLSAKAGPSPSVPQAIGTSLKWPWAADAKWYMTQSVHPWYKSKDGTKIIGPDSSLDFSTSGSDKSVHAAAAGTVVRRCESTTTREYIIRHPTGTSNDDVTGYLHLDKNNPLIPLGTHVNSGDSLGTIYNDAPNDVCSVGNGPHLHFWIATIPTSVSSQQDMSIYNFNFSSMYDQTICGWQMQSDGYFHKGSEKFYTYKDIPGDCSAPGPRPPSNLSANAVSSSQIDLSWSGSPDSVDGYRIYSGSAMVANQVASTIYSITGLSSCSTYSFYVTAYKGDLESSGSNPASATTLGCSSGAPSAPSLSSPGSGQVFGRYDAITLQWNSNGSYQYLPEFWGFPDNGISQLPWQAGTSLQIGGGIWGGTYSWHVKTMNSSGQFSDWSETRTFFKKYGTPNNVRVSPLSDSQTRLNWDPSADAPGNIEGYKIYRDDQLRATVGSGATSFDDYDLNCNSSYSYYLKAYKGDGESDATSTYSVTTNSCPPPGPSANFDAWPQSGTAPLVVAMHIVDTANINSCSWDYGDGQTGSSCDSLHNHTYYSAGSFTVKLDVSGPGGSDSMTLSGYINVLGSTNDDFNFADLIPEPPANGLATQILDPDTTDATVAPDDPDMGCETGVNSNTLWYKLVPSNHNLVRVRTYSKLDPSASSNYDTVLAVFTGQRGFLNRITCNDDASSHPPQSELTFEVVAGQTYYIEVANYGNPGGGVLSLFVNYEMPPSYQVYLPVAVNSNGSPPQPTPTPNPTLQYPSNPSLDCSGSNAVWDCTFSWDSVTGATEYYAEVWSTSGSGPWNSGWTGSTYFTVYGMSEQQNYSWRVKARNSAGESDWHPTMCFSMPPAQRSCP